MPGQPGGHRSGKPVREPLGSADHDRVRLAFRGDGAQFPGRAAIPHDHLDIQPGQVGAASSARSQPISSASGTTAKPMGRQTCTTTSQRSSRRAIPAAYASARLLAVEPSYPVRIGYRCSADPLPAGAIRWSGRAPCTALRSVPAPHPLGSPTGAAGSVMVSSLPALREDLPLAAAGGGCDGVRRSLEKGCNRHLRLPALALPCDRGAAGRAARQQLAGLAGSEYAQVRNGEAAGRVQQEVVGRGQHHQRGSGRVGPGQVTQPAAGSGDQGDGAPGGPGDVLGLPSPGPLA